MERFRNWINKVPTGLLSGVTLALILWLTLAPHPTGEIELPLFPGADKLVHALMFGFLTIVILLERMKHEHWNPLPLGEIGVIAFFTAVTGILIEVAQHLMGLGRSFEVLDILADTSGSFVAAAIWAAVENKIAKNSD